MRIHASETIERPVESIDEVGSAGWIVTVYDNPLNTYDEVINVLMVATNCDFDEAYLETWEIDHLGRSTVHHADQEECETVAAIIRQIGIRVETSPN